MFCYLLKYPFFKHKIKKNGDFLKNEFIKLINLLQQEHLFSVLGRIWRNLLWSRHYLVTFLHHVIPENFGYFIYLFKFKSNSSGLWVAYFPLTIT